MSKKKTYQERLQEAAKMHADKWNSHIQYEEEYEARFTDADCIEDGKVTVAAQAEAIRRYAGNLDMGDCVDWFLEDNGYVEPKNNNDEKGVL